MKEIKFYLMVFVAIVATSIIVGFFVCRARVHTPGNVKMSNKIERYELFVAQDQKNWEQWLLVNK